MSSIKKIAIIGCGAGGGTAAQFARKTDRSAMIAVFEKGKYPQYSKCGLPYVISGDIPSFDNLIEFSEEWFQKERINLFLNSTVQNIDIHKKILVAKQQNDIIEERFDKLIIASGAQPSIPPIQHIRINGKLGRGIHILRTIDDGKNILRDIEKGKKVIIIGAGLVGLELAEALYHKGMQVTVVESLPIILGTCFDEDISNILLLEIKKRITLLTQSIATSVKYLDDKVSSVLCKNTQTNQEKSLDCDLVIITTGIKQETTLAMNIGCKLGKAGGIIVNEKSETSISDVYAVGDCTEYRDFITQLPVNIGLGSIVVRQGIAAGINAAGGNYTLPSGVLLSRTSTIFGQEIAGTGPIMNAINHLPIVYGKVRGLSRPDYFPGAIPITMKITAHEETGQILSAQAIGSNASQRINVFAHAILTQTTVETLSKLETTYAPPIAPTLDVITIVCDVVSLKRSRKRR